MSAQEELLAQCAALLERALPACLGDDTTVLSLDDERAIAEDSDALTLTWLSAEVHLECSNNFDGGAGSLAQPSLDSEQFEVERTGDAVNDTVVYALCVARVALRARLRRRPRPGLARAVALHEELRRRAWQMGADFAGATADFDNFLDRAAAVLVYYASQGLCTFVAIHNAEELAAHEARPESLARLRAELERLTPAERQNRETRLATLREEAEHAATVGVQMGRESRERRRVLFAPTVFAAWLATYYWSVMAVWALERSPETGGLFRYEADTPGDRTATAAVVAAVDARTRSFMKTDDSPRVLGMYAALLQLPLWAFEFTLRREGGTREQLEPADILTRFRTRDDIQAWRELLGEQVEVRGERRELASADPAWRVMLWSMLFRYYCGHDFSTYVLWAVDLEQQDALLLGEPGSLPLLVYVGRGWHVRSVCPDTGERRLRHHTAGFESAVAQWCADVRAPPFGGEVAPGVNISTGLALALRETTKERIRQQYRSHDAVARDSRLDALARLLHSTEVDLEAAHALPRAGDLAAARLREEEARAASDPAQQPEDLAPALRYAEDVLPPTPVEPVAEVPTAITHASAHDRWNTALRPGESRGARRRRLELEAEFGGGDEDEGEEAPRIRRRRLNPFAGLGARRVDA